MFRTWPNIEDENTLSVWFPKNIALLHVCITGAFFVFTSICIFFSGRVFATEGITMITGIGIIVFGILWTCTGYFFIKYLRVILGKGLLTFLANKEGLFLDIGINPKEAFFIPWAEIEGFSTRNVNDPFWNEGGRRTRSYTLSISFTEKIGQKIPNHLKNVAAATKKEINLHATRIDLDLEDAVKKLNEMKTRFSTT